MFTIKELIELLRRTTTQMEGIEDPGFNSILPYLIQYSNSKVILYADESVGFHCLRWCYSKGIEPIGFIGDDIKYDFDIPKIEINHLKTYTEQNSIIVLIAHKQYKYEYDCDNIRAVLYRSGVRAVYNMDFNFFVPYYEWKYYFRTHYNAFVKTYELLHDDASKEIFYEYVRAIMDDDIYRKPSEKTTLKYFGNGLFTWRTDECFVNCGLYLGDTIFHMIETKGDFEAVYGFEMEQHLYRGAIEYLSVLPAHFYEKMNLYPLMLGRSGENALDNILNSCKVTLISLDAEGAEMDILAGASNILTEQKPVLAISMYHKKDDLITIPGYLDGLQIGYKFFLRKYEPAAKKYSKDELILYAIPQDRLI